MNHAVFCVTPIERATSQEETPFLELASIHTVQIHLSSPIGLSSKIVPVLTLNCFLQPLHCQIRRAFRKVGSRQPHFRQKGPFGKHRSTMNSRAISGSEKYMIACCKVVGTLISVCIGLPLSICVFLLIYSNVRSLTGNPGRNFPKKNDTESFCVVRVTYFAKQFLVVFLPNQYDVF